MSRTPFGGGASHTTDPAAGTSSATDVSLREVVGIQIGYESRIARLLVWFVGIGGAFAWSQIQRRLEILNHENARVASIAEKTVSSDTYKSDEERRSDEREKLDQWRQGADEKFTKSLGRDEFQRETKTERRTNLTLAHALIATAVSIVGISLALLTYHALHSRAPAVPAQTVTTTVTVTTPRP